MFILDDGGNGTEVNESKSRTHPVHDKGAKSPFMSLGRSVDVRLQRDWLDRSSRELEGGIGAPG